MMLAYIDANPKDCDAAEQTVARKNQVISPEEEAVMFIAYVVRCTSPPPLASPPPTGLNPFPRSQYAQGPEETRGQPACVQEREQWQRRRPSWERVGGRSRRRPHRGGRAARGG
jgi:hypothetical protein